MTVSVRASLDQFDLAHPNGSGRLEISVAAPARIDPGSKVPVLYVLDSDLLFGMASEISRAIMNAEAMPPHYVVGVGYGAEYGEVLKLRTADLSPPLDQVDASDLGALGAMIGADVNGGADSFLSFIVETLKREIGSRYPHTNGAESFLFGHSLGGLFTAHALLTRPDAFDAFLASSPSLWWNGFAILKRLPDFEQRLKALERKPRVFIDVGGTEQDLADSVPPGVDISLEALHAVISNARTVDAAREFAEALGRAGIEELRHVAFAGEDHVSVTAPALLHATRFAMRHKS